MGKFKGVLILSDYDNTINFTEPSLKSGTPPPPLSQENRRAIEYFMAQGGIFSVATGRALPAFDPVRSDVPFNGPTILFNGAAIYDYAAGRYLCTAFLPPDAAAYAQQVLDAFPALALEVYHDDNNIHAVQPNELSRRRLHLTHAPTVTCRSLAEVPAPYSKMVFPSEDMAALDAAEAFIAAQPWGRQLSIVRSATLLLECTAFGADKGSMADRLASMLNIAPEHVYCAGDHANDISMLRRARIPFAPANAIDEVKAIPGIRILPHCRENAIAAMIEQLDALY
ncbi:MAG: HAD family phosphatase [Oscillospiraceae bacterium]|nr:HAD family phosphatase [Oscillospiraceae bacterium]